MGDVDFVVGLDSGCGDYERLWATTSLRGLVGGTLTRRRADRGRAFRRCERRRSRRRFASRAAARPARGQRDRAACCRRPSTRRSPTSASRRRRRAAAIMGETTIRQVSVRATRQPMVADHAEALLESHVAPGAVGHRRRRTSRHRRCGQRAAAANRAQAFAAPAAVRWTAPPRRRTHAAAARADPPLWRERALRRRRRRDRMERAADRAVARSALDEAASQAFYGKPSAAMGEGGTIPFMAMLGKHFPARPVPDHRRARSQIERARPERVPAHSVRDEADRVRRERFWPRTRRR